MSETMLVITDILVIIGLLMTTIATVGLLRLRDLYNRIHAAGQAVFLGLAPLLAAIVLAAEAPSISKAVLLGVFILVTAPISAHALARATYHRNQRVDEAMRARRRPRTGHRDTEKQR